MLKKVLVVDDVLVITDFVKMVLEMNGYKVVVANNGYQAINIVKSDKNIGLILLDLMMPDINGWETLQKIREFKSKDELPVIIFTGNIREFENLERNPLKDEISDFILKPVNYEQLVESVKKYLKD